MSLYASKQEVHTWHNINATSGEWVAKFQMINEKGTFVATDGSPISELTVTAGNPKIYGFSFDPSDDFNVAYTSTLIQQKDKSAKMINATMFQSKACVFVITAVGPAQPDVRVSNFNGATCTWMTVPGVGEDFFAS